MREDGVCSEEQLPLNWYLLSSIPFCDSKAHSIMCPLQVAAEDKPLRHGVFFQNGLKLDIEDNCVGILVSQLTQQPSVALRFGEAAV